MESKQEVNKRCQEETVQALRARNEGRCRARWAVCLPIMWRDSYTQGRRSLLPDQVPQMWKYDGEEMKWRKARR